MSLSSISLWPRSGLSASRAAPLALIWVILVQAISCAMGGYLAGRLRTRWATLHTHEVYFRDTAHGFLVWAVGLVISVAFLSSVALSIAKEGPVRTEGLDDYYVNLLFRTAHPAVETTDASLRAEAKEVLAMAVLEPTIRPRDKTYLADMVAARTGLARPQAETRVDETVSDYRHAVDAARKAVAHSLYWLFAALLVGAFCGSFSATIGGRRRDHVLPANSTMKPARRL
jgi:hypothetical protein